MRLLTLTLSNFQGIKDLTIDLSGANASISGDNGTGKSTLFNAVTWLLFDKPSTGAKNFTPKTRGPEGDLHGLDHSVEAVFSLDDGRIITMKKTFREKWNKKKGSSTKEFTGHEVVHQIDGVPVKEKEYLETLQNYCGDENLIKILMIPGYFAEELPWDKRREILLDVCGNIDDQDVVESSKELANLNNYLLMPGTDDQYYSVNEYKKIASSKKAEINKELQLIPARIDEAAKAIKDNKTSAGSSAIEASMKDLKEQLEAKKQEKVQALSEDGAMAAINQKINVLMQKRAEAKTAYMEQEARENEETYREINRVSKERSELVKQGNQKKIDLGTEKKYLKEMNSNRANLLQEYNMIQQSKWFGDEICPTCSQPLPADEIEKAKEQFNLNKSNQLLELNQRGQQTCSKDMIAELDKRITDLGAEVYELDTGIEELLTMENNLRAGLVQKDPFEKTAEYLEINKQIAVLQGDRTVAAGQVEKLSRAINVEISDLEQRLNEAMSDKAKYELIDRQRKRTKELEAREKQLAQEFEDLQKGIFLCEEFVKAKVSLLTEKINSKFESVRFRLFVEQINGGIKEDCEVLVPSDGRLVPYAFANNAGRINAGLEIISALSKHWGISVPVFVDNAESVTRLIDPETQLIRLIVSEPDKELRVELEEERV